MDEGLLNDLLECSVCLERLDTSSRVLPCQHTFCLKCLKEIVSSHGELRCPECRIAVAARVEDLPPNVLLMRILEGMRSKHSAQSTPQTCGGGAAKLSEAEPTPQARALYDYVPKEPGDLAFKKGNVIQLHKRVDALWLKGECEGRVGIFPASYVQVVGGVSTQLALCKALYDFRMSAPDEEGCLAFDKGTVITVLRRVDDNWAEGKLEGRVGIFPIAFVELNRAAKELIHSHGTLPATRPVVASQEQTTRARVDTQRAHVQQTVHNQQMTVSTPISQKYQHVSMSQSHPVYYPSGTFGQILAPQTAAASRPQKDLIQLTNNKKIYDRAKENISNFNNTSDSSTTNSSSAPNSSNSSSNSTQPSSPTSNDNNDNSQVNASVSLPPILDNLTLNETERNVPTGELLKLNAQKENRLRDKDKRNSLTPSSHNVPHQANLNRHSAEVSALVGRARSGERAPPSFVALYHYRPRRPDELELKKGALYTVAEKCRDGWYKGCSVRSQRCGVFPGNYVAPITKKHHDKMLGQASTSPKTPAVAPAPDAPPRNDSPQGQPHSFPWSNSDQPTPRSAEKTKDKSSKQDKGAGLMKRLAAIKKSKSPPPGMDNPVFEDCSERPRPAHVRSGSCPSQLVGGRGASVRARRDKPAPPPATQPPATTTATHKQREGVWGSSHRKTQSLDAGNREQRRQPQLNERFRCVVAYPANSEHELELGVDDVVLVHRKRGDGWYRGTHERTGRVGLFPASFVHRA